MFRRVAAAAVLNGILLTSITAASSAPASIVVDGNRRIDADSIRSYFPPASQKDLSEAELDAALKSMYRSNLFARVDISRQRDGVHVHVEENPVIARIAFEGNSKIKDKQLVALVQSKTNGPLSKPLVQQDVQRLIEAYKSHGHFKASVVPKTIAGRDGRADLVFEVKEAERTGIGDIVFVGNAAVSANSLKGVIKSGQTNILSLLLDNDLYDADKVEADRDLLRRFYRSRGYFDITIISAGPRYDEARKSLVLTFTINEGQKYRLGSVKLESDVQGVDTGRLSNLLLTRTGDVYNGDAVEKTIQDLSIGLRGQGRPFATPRLQEERVEDERLVNLVYRIEQGAPAYVERIEIHGNGKTRDNVIRREIEIGEGDAYNQALIDASETRLKKLGYFKSVKFSKAAGSAPDRVVLNVAVEEQKTAEFSVSGGYSNVDGWLGEVSASDSNLFGSGQHGKVSVSFGEYTKGFDVAFTEPYILGQRISLGTDIFAKQTSASDYHSYSSTTYGSSLTVGTPLTDTLALAWRYSIKNQSLELDPSKGVSSLPVQEAAAAGAQWVSTVGSGVTYDTRDSNRNPTKGLRLEVNNDVAGFGGDVKFLRNTDDLRYYHKITDDIVGMAHVQSGYVVPWGGQPLPLLNGFFGGPQLVRGFRPNGFGPRDLTPGTTMDNVGGNAYWATSYEMQTPMPFIPQSIGLKAAVFADAGSLWSTGAAGSSPALSGSLIGNSRAVRSSAGAGLVWDSILGPIRMDYAYPLTKANYDVTQRLHFGYGMF